MRAWIGAAFGGSDNPYADEPSVSYAYDEFVQNHKQVGEGDLLFIRNRDRLEGVGRIERIDIGSGEKSLDRCPACGSRRFHSRKTMEPLYKCAEGHTFDEPVESREQVRTYRAIYQGSYCAVSKHVTALELRPFHLRNSQQMAIMPVDLDRISGYLVNRDPGATKALSQWLGGRARDLADEEGSDEIELTPVGVDERAKVLRGIRARRGQTKFRKDLISRYGAKCLVSGSRVTSVLEAAHIRPYRGPRDNHPSNGLLLRSDLHTLYDLHRIGVEPESLKIVVAASLRDSDYFQYKGTRLMVSNNARPNEDALRIRWRAFQTRVNGNGDG